MTSGIFSNNSNPMTPAEMQQVVEVLGNMDERNRLIEIVNYEEAIMSHEFYSFLDNGQRSGNEVFRKVFASVNLLLRLTNENTSEQQNIPNLSPKELFDRLEPLSEHERIVGIIKYSDTILNPEFNTFVNRFFNEQILGQDIIKKRIEKYGKVLDSIDTITLIGRQRTKKQNLAKRNQMIKDAVLGVGIVGIGFIGATALLNMLGNAGTSTQNNRRSRRHGFIRGGTDYQMVCSQCGAVSATGGTCDYCHSNEVFQEQVRIEEDFQDYARQQQDIEYYNNQDFYNSQDFY